MRFLILDTCYPSFLRAHYARDPALAKQSYAHQWRSLMDTFFGTADAYSHALGELGHEAHEIVANAAPSARGLGPRARLTVVAAFPAKTRAARSGAERGIRTGHRLRPEHEVFLAQSARPASPARCAHRRADRERTAVRREAAGIRPRADIVPALRRALPRCGVRAEYLRIGFDPRVLARLEAEGAERERHGAVFVGALNRTQHSSGNAVLERAAARAPIEFWGYGAERWPQSSPIQAHYNGEAWGIDMFRVLYESTLALNRHIEVAERFANNMRLYEATGVGTMLLTDEKENLDDLFVPGREIATYRGEDELVDRVNHYLEHDDERREVAMAGQARTLREHTYRHRMEELLAILRDSGQ